MSRKQCTRVGMGTTLSIKRTTFKFCILGDGGVGKTTLIRRYLSGSYLGDTKMTIGVDFHTHKITHEDRLIVFQIWDLSGQQRFQQMRVFESYVHGSHAIMIAVDLSQIDTFERLPTWLELTKKAESTHPLLILVGTKKDLEREVDQKLLDDWAREHEFFSCFETSAKTGENVNELFDQVTSELLSKWARSTS